MPTTWIVVADEAIARILQSEDGHATEPVQELTDPDAHAKGAELRRDAGGRRAVSGTGGNATTSAGPNERHVEAEVFSRRVADYLGRAYHEHRFDELRIVAAPRFLGLLRKSMNHDLARVVSQEIDKDLVHMGDSDIANRVFNAKKDGPAARV